MLKNKPKDIALEHSGDHHQAKVLVNKKTKKVTGGAVYNFANNSAVGLSLDNKGQMSGTILGLTEKVKGL